MEKWNLIIDVARCENCNNCVLATSDEHVGNDYPNYSAPHAQQGERVVRIRRKVRGATPMVDVAYLPTMCMHCDRAPCVEASAGAISKRPDGLVIIDPVKGKGHRELVESCPYGAIVWNEEQQLPQNWIFEAHRLDAGAQSLRISDVCPTSVFELVRTTDATMAERAATEGLRVLKPELGTKPRVWYRNLERFDGCFIGGSVSRLRNAVLDCIEAATVELRQAGATVAATTTDAFGDFRFDGLAPDSGNYEIRIAHDGLIRTLAVTLAFESIYLGEIALT
jgi:Fe-S-cluster-containing dehydrogenase component